jgi:PEP-CTERM motif
MSLSAMSLNTLSLNTLSLNTLSLNTLFLNVLKLAKVSALVAITAGVTVVVNPSQAQAGPWDYAVGGQNNGTGGSVFDYRGIAIKEEGNDIIIALNTNMTLNGSLWRNEVINYGDLFLNFSGKSFKEASDAGELFGVHFATVGSQSGVQDVGLYKNVKAKNTTRQNYGWHNTTSWSNAVKGNNSYGDLTSSDSYFAGQQTGQKAILNAIDTGTKIGGLMMMSSGDLAAAGLNFASATGSKGEQAEGTVTLGFKITKTADFKAGNFIANLFAECGNDGLAIKSVLAQGKVPEPATMAGMALVGGLGLLRRKRRQG